MTVNSVRMLRFYQGFLVHPLRSVSTFARFE